MARLSGSIAGALLGLALLGSPLSAQESASADAAKTLTALLQERKLDAAAARDPAQPDRFVAALYFAGAQLLVISSVHPVPALLEQRLAQQQYRDVYTDLHGAGVREGRIFVTDLQANGLRRTRESGQPFDIVYRDGVNQASYDGDWRGQKLSESQYTARFQKDDADYARMLTALADALKAPTTRGAAPAGNSVPVEHDFGRKVVYGTNPQAPVERLRADCARRGGRFNECGSPCRSAADVCVEVCALTCEEIPERSREAPPAADAGWPR